MCLCLGLCIGFTCSRAAFHRNVFAHIANSVTIPFQERLPAAVVFVIRASICYRLADQTIKLKAWWGLCSQSGKWFHQRPECSKILDTFWYIMIGFDRHAAGTAAKAHLKSVMSKFLPQVRKRKRICMNLHEFGGNAQHYASTIAGYIRPHHFSSASHSFLRPYGLCWLRFAFKNPVDCSLRNQQVEFHTWFKNQTCVHHLHHKIDGLIQHSTKQHET